MVGRVDAVEGVVQRGEDQANVGRHGRQNVAEVVATRKREIEERVRGNTTHDETKTNCNVWATYRVST